MLGTSDECEYKATKRGLVRRSESELIKWLSVRYDEKRREYELRQEAKERTAQAKLEDCPQIQELMQSWLEDEVQPSVKQGTLSEYRRTCNLFLEICGISTKI